jgi:hypothetical protein
MRAFDNYQHGKRKRAERRFALVAGECEVTPG